MEQAIYFGHTVEYWLELEKHAQELKAVDFIEEIVKLRGKVNFYESRIEEMNNLKSRAN